MAKIFKLPDKPPDKFGYKRVDKRSKRKKKPDKYGQLNLFQNKPGKILLFPSKLSPFEEALLLDDRGNEKAADLYWKAISMGECVDDAYCNLGILESKNKKGIKAFDCFTMSLTNNPRHFESHFNLANLYFEIGDLRLAKGHYEIALEIDPGYPNLYFNLGIVHAMNDEYESALVALYKYKEMVSENEGKKADKLLKSLKRSLAVQG